MRIWMAFLTQMCLKRGFGKILPKRLFKELGFEGEGAPGQPPPLQTSPPLSRMGAVSQDPLSEAAIRLIT